MADAGRRPCGPTTIDFDDHQIRRVSLRPAPEAADTAGRSSLPSADAPLVRRRRWRSRLLAWIVGSGAVHLLAVVLLLATRPSGTPPTNEPPSVEMVFGHNGSAGLQGPSVPQADQGEMPAPPPEATPPPEALPPPPPLPVPTPEPAPAPSPVVPEPRREAARERPRHDVRRQRASSNPFADLTNLSLAPLDVAPTPRFTRRGRGGSGNSISLSVGPLVKGGRLDMPFSMRGGHGMTSDYQEMLDDWVNRHKFYPQTAADRGHDGQVAIHVEWDRDGRVLKVGMIYGSGDQDLDDAWLSVFRGAHLPPPPPDMPGDPIQYDMIMNYELLR